MERISRNKIKLFKSLKQKKYREELKQFIAEGNKTVEDLIRNHPESIKYVIAKESWYKDQRQITTRSTKLYTASNDELKTISGLSTASDVLAVVEIPQNDLEPENLKNKLTIALDQIRDPGNMGTIIRIANWYGIENIICSEHTVECYNPKVVQASMGSILNVKIHYKNLSEILSQIQKLKIVPVYGSSIKGDAISQITLPEHALLVFGNESRGISKEIEHFTDFQLSISSDFKTLPSIDSLNVSVAVAIFCYEFRRNLN
jgi:RNA methyltransferase, TrmH family